jgi:hypothetical protein
MRAALLAVLILAGCRTAPLDAVADAAPPDAAASDLARAGCPISCNSSTELCVFLNRGDCSKWTCAPRPAACAAAPSCACLGGDSFCAGFAQPGETLTCRAPDPGLGGDVTCQSTIQCV